jgi:hypothetical protein
LILLIPASGWAVSWDKLAPEEQKLLAPLEQSWDQLPEKRQQKLQNGAKRYQELNPNQRQNFKLKFETWKKKSPEEKQRLRSTRENFENMSPEQKIKLRENFKKLSPEELQELFQLSQKRRDELKNTIPDNRKNLGNQIRQDQINQQRNQRNKSLFLEQRKKQTLDRSRLPKQKPIPPFKKRMSLNKIAENLFHTPEAHEIHARVGF